MNKTRSTGPITPEGKKRSSMNAAKHGLAGRTVVLPSEDLVIYRKFSDDILATLRPANPLEHELAQTIADGYWRLRRVRTTEDALFALGHEEGHGEFDADHEAIHAAYTEAKAFRANPQAFATLSIYEQRIHRGIEKATKQLEAMQSARKAQREDEINRVLRLRDYNKMLDLPYNPAEDGFVYSTAEIELEAHRRERMYHARIAERVDFNREKFLKRAA